MSWFDDDQILQFSVTEDRKSDYLRTWVSWNIDTDQLSLVSQPQTLDALRVASALDVYNVLMSSNDTTHLSMSPDSSRAVYLDDNHLFVVHDFSMPEPVDLGHLTENLDDVAIYWITEDDVVVVATPIYGSGFEIFHICTDGECFVNVSALADNFTSKPFINKQDETVVFHIGDEILSYSVREHAIQSRVQLPVRALITLQPIVDADWSYFVGFDQSNIDLALYGFNQATNALDLLKAVDIDPEYFSDWIIAPHRHLAIFATPTLQVACY
ncbi:MAG: hypothetical protein KC615_07135 [Anaerolineae bacterium]|nr:hypothetical protein [Anaerolineae bacterium]